MFVTSLLPQVYAQDLIVACVVKDKALNAVLPFVNIYNESTEEGTISNVEGKFRLKVRAREDVLRISMIGYEIVKMRVSELLSMEVVYLESKSAELNEVRVYANKTPLYNVISKCRRKGVYELNNRFRYKRNSKCYFELKTYVGDKNSEFIEGYYNGDLSTYHIDKLNFKNGRIKLDSIGGRYYLNTGTSHVFYMYHMFKASERFPLSPLQLSLGELKKVFDVTLEQTYKNEDKHTCFIINYKPKTDHANYFSGKLWIDIETYNVEKGHFKIEQTKRHPFKVFAGSSKLVCVDLEMTHSFSAQKDIMYPKSIDFNYAMHYESVNLFEADSSFSTETSAVIYVYKYDNHFMLPQYHFNSKKFVDFRRISCATYNYDFWNNMTEFTLNDKRSKSELFIKEDTLMNELLTSIAFQEYNRFLQGVYIWSKERYKAKLEYDSTQQMGVQHQLRKFHYNLEPKIYLDISHINDSTYIYSKTVLDLNDSYYKFPVTPVGLAFINMCIDLVEVERRALVDMIQEREMTEKEITDLYELVRFRLEKQKQQFFKLAKGGTNLKAMMRYNSIIKDALGIDNVKIFGLDKGE